ncbi:MAG: alcohol dehydrogenase catalytic domain-containing protein [Pseudomonadota bacterium]
MVEKMKAVVIQPNNKIGLEDVPKPHILKNEEAIVRVSMAAICGSDLHAKHGLLPGVMPGDVIGHEFVGIITEVGSFVTRFKPGDRVTAPPAYWCGICPACQRGDIAYCRNGGIYGVGELISKGYQGAQTSYIRIAYADNCLSAVPDTIPDEQAVLVPDVLQVGYHAAFEGHIAVGDTVVIFGCGPIGIGALISAQLFGPKRVISVDMRDMRLNVARHYGATVIDARRENVKEKIKDLTDGEGADVAIEAVGIPEVFLQALGSVRRFGTVSVVGVFSQPVELPLQDYAAKANGVRLSIGLGHIGRTSKLLGLLESGRLDLSPLVTHTFPLSDAVEAYDLFENHQDDCMKVLLKP